MPIAILYAFLIESPECATQPLTCIQGSFIVNRSSYECSAALGSAMFQYKEVMYNREGSPRLMISSF